MHDYFAYGSNLEPVQMKLRCPGAVPCGRAVLRDHRLCFPVRSDGDWAGGVASIEPASGRVVHGIVYRITERHLAALDLYEAVAEGMYRRDRVEVDREHEADPRLVWTYFAFPDPAGPTPPSRRYLDAILRGATHYGLPRDYLDQLAAIRTLDAEGLN
jgi:hypothetical protein